MIRLRQNVKVIGNGSCKGFFKNKSIFMSCTFLFVKRNYGLIESRLVKLPVVCGSKYRDE